MFQQLGWFFPVIHECLNLSAVKGEDS
jgi:hypothetical protein